MSQSHDNDVHTPESRHEDDLERLLQEGVSLTDSIIPPSPVTTSDEEEEKTPEHDIQGSLALFAEATQDMATASVELGLGRHFACADYCNQVAEKAAQAVSLRRFGRRSVYDHDLRALGSLVGAPADVQDEMARLTPFHPEAFYADTPPEEADAVINAEQAAAHIKSARTVQRWARSIVLQM